MWLNCCFSPVHNLIIKGERFQPVVAVAAGCLLSLCMLRHGSFPCFKKKKCCLPLTRYPSRSVHIHRQTEDRQITQLEKHPHYLHKVQAMFSRGRLGSAGELMPIPACFVFGETPPGRFFSQTQSHLQAIRNHQCSLMANTPERTRWWQEEKTLKVTVHPKTQIQPLSFHPCADGKSGEVW